MKISRRDTIKMAGMAAAAAVLPPFVSAAAAGRSGSPMRFSARALLTPTSSYVYS